MFTTEARKLYFSKMFERPLAEMQRRVDELLGYREAGSPLRYMIYSAHDDQIANVMEWLPATNVRQDTILFAANVFFELAYDENCLVNTSLMVDCFKVYTRWNGNPVHLAPCGELGSDSCTYLEFLDVMRTIAYDGPYYGNLKEACK